MMVWTTPRTWVTGDVVTSGQMNTELRDNQNFLYNVPRHRAYHSGYLLFLNSTVMNITTTRQIYDTDNMWASGNSHAADINTAGLFACGAGWAHGQYDGEGVREVKAIRYDGALQDEIFRQKYIVGTHAGGETQHMRVVGSGESVFTTGEFILFQTFHDAGADIADLPVSDCAPGHWATWRGV